MERTGGARMRSALGTAGAMCLMGCVAQGDPEDPTDWFDPGTGQPQIGLFESHGQLVCCFQYPVRIALLAYRDQYYHGLASSRENKYLNLILASPIDIYCLSVVDYP